MASDCSDEDKKDNRILYLLISNTPQVTINPDVEGGLILSDDKS